MGNITLHDNLSIATCLGIPKEEVKNQRKQINTLTQFVFALKFQHNLWPRWEGVCIAFKGIW